MGIFNNIFGGKEEKASKPEKKTYLNWIPLTTIEQLEEIKEISKTEPVLSLNILLVVELVVWL